MCFIHVLLNALDMHDKGHDVKIVMEGASTKLIPDLEGQGSPLSALYVKVKGLGLIDAVCKACSATNKVLEAVESAGLPLGDEMSGHPSLARYVEDGYTIVTF